MNGFAIRAIRISKNMSQREFADTLGISPTWLCEIEKERRPVSDRVRIRVSQLYGDDDAVEMIRRAKMSEQLTV
ncbi:helix-turn-helix domain-containing protein [Paenibacillus macerans]|uniref:helix-turn-helix domain-containing protein n=1 Tax=Paenibacillus macerans TaxID=44252 RepID=UPI003D314033